MRARVARRGIVDRRNPIDWRIGGKIIVTGPSGTGKSTYVEKLLASCLLRPCPKRRPILVLYRIWQPLYDRLVAAHGSRIMFLQSEFNAEVVRKLRSLAPATLILDDLMDSVTKEVGEMFTTLSHHLKSTVILVMQNLWLNSREMVTIRRNMDLVVLFDCPQDRLSIRTLAHRLFPERARRFLRAYTDAVSASNDGVLVVDMRARVNRQFSIRTDIFSPLKMRTYDFGR